MVDTNPFFFSSRRRHTRFSRDWSSDVCSSDLREEAAVREPDGADRPGPRLGMPVEHADDLPEVGQQRLAVGSEGRFLQVLRSEERRVGKECRSGWWLVVEEEEMRCVGGGCVCS